MPDPSLARTVRRNIAVLAACMALMWSVVQLLATISAPVLTGVAGRPAVAGLGWALYVASWAVATLGAGRFMDARGRAAGIRVGFVVGAVGCAILFRAAHHRSLVYFTVGMILAGAGSGAVNLARAAAGDMYPPERRARGIGYVLAGAALGAVLGPAVFTPLLARSGADLDVLATPCLAAAAVMLAGAALTFAIRTDPLRIAAMLPRSTPEQSPRSLSTIVAVPIVRRALAVALVSQAVMTSIMSVMSLNMRTHGHRWPAIAVTMSVHFLGMFGLALVVGPMVDRFGRAGSAVYGLVVLAGGAFLLLAGEALVSVVPGMWAIGIGWNVAFVAATAMLADATQPHERARMLGFSDFVALGSAAVGAVAAGAVLGRWGLPPLAIGAAALALAAAAVIAAHPPRPGATVVPEPRCP